MRLQSCIICSAQPRLRWECPYFFVTSLFQFKFVLIVLFQRRCFFLTKKKSKYKKLTWLFVHFERKINHKNWSNVFFSLIVLAVILKEIHNLKRKFDILSRQKTKCIFGALLWRCFKMIWYETIARTNDMAKSREKKSEKTSQLIQTILRTIGKTFRHYS